MTDTAPEQTEDYAPEGDGEAYPQYPDNPHNHRFTVSYDPNKPPFVVVRANTAAELKAALAELEATGVYAAMGAAYDTLKRQGAVGAGIPSPAPQGPPPAPGTGPQYNPAMPPPQPAGSAPAAWQNAGAPPAAPIPAPPQGQWAPPVQAPSEYTQHRWLRLDVPFPKKGEFEAICNQYQMRKGRPTEGGQYSFNKGDRAGVKGWHVAPDYAGAFPMFNPVPA